MSSLFTRLITDIRTGEFGIKDGREFVLLPGTAETHFAHSFLSVEIERK
jgi:hypothetical protein